MVFDKRGAHNTDDTVRAVLQGARERGIGTVVVASNTGVSALPFIGCGLDVVCVGHAQGFARTGENEMDPGNRKKLGEAGIPVVIASHVLSGAERAFSNRFSGVYPVEVMAYTLRMLGQGVKVAVEIAVMALDAGVIPAGKPVVAAGGTGRGLDTAVVLTPAHAQNILDTKIHEILCKPYNP